MAQDTSSPGDPLARVAQLITQTTPLAVEDIRPEARLVEDLGLVSLELALLASLVESEFSLRFEEGDLIAVQTVKDILDLVARYQAARG